MPRDDYVFGVSRYAPGLVVLEDLGRPVYAHAVPLARRAAGFSGRYAAGADLTAGRLVAVVGGVLLPWSSGLAPFGVVLAKPRVTTYPAGYAPLVLRRGIVTVDLDGTAGNDQDGVRVLAGGVFAAAGGEVLARAVFVDGAVEINL